MMRSLGLTNLLVVIAAWAPNAHAAGETRTVQQGYTTSTLREPIFDSARVVVETVRLNNWLASNYDRLKPEQMKRPREHLYYLIDSRVKETFVSQATILPNVHDPILEVLFSWAERIGVYGGALAYNAVKSPGANEMRPTLVLPEDMALRLTGDLFEIRSKSGAWTVTFPYYFMIGNIVERVATNGIHMQVVSISTGAAKDQSQLGHSQATLILVFTPTPNVKKLAEIWKRHLGMAEEDEVPIGVNGLSSWRTFDVPAKLHKELTVWKAAQGSFAVAYLGLRGTYQWNRPHFLDFVRAVKF